MHFHAENPARAKRIAKRLRSLLSEAGVSASLPACQNAVAEMYGFAHYREMTANQGLHRLSPNDEEAGPAIASERRARHVDVLAHAFGLTMVKASELIKDIAPTAAHKSSVIDERKSSIFAFDRPEIGGAAFSWQRANGAYRTALIAASSEGQLIYKQADHIKVTDDAGVDSLLSQHTHFYHPDYVLGKLGFRQHVQAAFWGAEDAAHLPADVLKRARTSIEIRLDPTVMKAVFGADGEMSHQAKFNYYRESGTEGDRRRNFALRYPSLALLAVDKAGENIHVDPDIAAEQIIRRMGLPRKNDAERVAALLRRIPNWGFEFESRIVTAFQVLAHLPDDRAPHSVKEAAALMSVVEMLGQAVTNEMTDYGSRIANIALTIPGKSWTDAEATLRSVAETAIGRLTQESILLVSKDDYPDMTTPTARADAIDHLFEAMGRMTSAFSWNVLLAGAARSNESVRHYWLTGEHDVGHDEDTDKAAFTEIMPPRYAATCVGAFLDDISFRDLTDVCERWHRKEETDSMPDVDSLDEGVLESAMDDWRTYFADKHREITVEEIVAMSEADMAANDESYGKLRKPAAQGSKRKPKKKLLDPYRDNPALRAERDDAQNPFHIVIIRDTTLTGRMSADGPYILIERRGSRLGGVALGYGCSVQPYTGNDQHEIHYDPRGTKWGIFKYDNQFRAPLVDFTETDARRLATEFGVEFNRDFTTDFRSSKAWASLKNWVNSFPETAALYADRDSYIRGWYRAAIEENQTEHVSAARPAP